MSSRWQSVLFPFSYYIRTAPTCEPLIPVELWSCYFPAGNHHVYGLNTVHGVLEARILKWLAIPFSSGPRSVRPLHHDPPVLGCPAGMAWFHWVRQGCPVPSLHGKYMGKQWKQWKTLFGGARKSLQMVIAAMKLKDTCYLEEKLWPTSTAYWKVETSLCQQSSIESKLWFFQ